VSGIAISYPPATIQTFGKKVLVGMPWQKTTNPLTAFCVNRIVDTRRCAMTLNHGDAFVAHTRNSIVDVLLKSPLEWLLTIDDDMVMPTGSADVFRSYTGWNVPEPFASFHVLDRLMSHQKTLVGALYFGRQSTSSPPVYNEGMANKSEAEYARKGPYDLIKPTRWVGTGCLLAHRSVFEDIEKRFPKLARAEGRGGNWFTSTEASLRMETEKICDSLKSNLTPEGAYKAASELSHALAVAQVENPLGCGEDVSFGLRAAAAGHISYVDMGCRCGHLGSFCY
jgi:hypothetical protein